MKAEFKFQPLTDDSLEGYVRQDRNNRRAVVFVHGFGGDIRKTWEGETSGKLFQALLSEDQELSDFNFLSFGYESGLMGGASAANIAVQLKNEINTHLSGFQIVLVAHSLGGIVCMRYILNLLEKGEPFRVIGLVMFGTPTSGVELVKAAELGSWALDLKLPGVGTFLRWFIRRNKQMQELAAHSEFLQDVHDNWNYRVANGGNSAEADTTRRAFMNVRVVTGNEDWVVKEHSAKGIYGEIDWYPLKFGHIALVKPESTTDGRYLALKTFLKQCLTGLEPPRLSRVKHFAEKIWALRSDPAIRHWTFTADLDLANDHPVDTLANAGFAISSFSCRYKRVLTNPSLVIGMSIGHAARQHAWDQLPQPFYVHQLLVDLLPESARGALTEAVKNELRNADVQSQWHTFFPEISVKINGFNTVAGRIVPDNEGPNVGWLRRTFELPADQNHLVGEEVEFLLTYKSAVPKSLSSYYVFYPWLVDGCNCTVKVNGHLETFVPVYNLPRGIQFTAQEEPATSTYRSLNVRSDDLFLPGSNFSVFWSQKATT